MFLRDLIKQARSILPLFSDAFTDNLQVNSVSKTGDDVTVNAISNGLSVGDEVIISGVKTEVQITNITTVNGIATATTLVDHDLTYKFTVTAEISSIEPAYDGFFAILEVPTNNTFTFFVGGSPLDSTGILKTFHNVGFNGVQVVTAIIDADNFQYKLSNNRLTTGSGENMLMMTRPRISGAADVGKSTLSYTRKEEDELWGFFVLNGMTTSDDRTVHNDAKNERQAQTDDFKLRLINDISFLIYIPTKNQISGREAVDLAQDLARPIYKALAGYVPESVFTSDPNTQLMPSGHSIFDYNDAYIIYSFDFQCTEFMLATGDNKNISTFMSNSGDILPNIRTESFRFFENDFINEFSETIKDDQGEINP